MAHSYLAECEITLAAMLGRDRGDSARNLSGLTGTLCKRAALSPMDNTQS